jgi:hypothetical protein
VFALGGERYVLMAQMLSAVEVRELGDLVGSLGDQGEAVLGALDFLVTGVLGRPAQALVQQSVYRLTSALPDARASKQEAKPDKPQTAHVVAPS